MIGRGQEIFLKKKIKIPNAEFIRDKSFNLFLNENYTNLEANEIVSAIKKVENYYLKKE